MILLAALCFTACSDSVRADSALEEPVRVGYFIDSQPFEAQFFAGDMPGPTTGPTIAGVDIGPVQVAPGKQGKGGYTVRLDKSAYAVAIRLQGRKNGYWIARVDQPEQLFANQVSASLDFDISPDMTAGNYQLELSGVGGDSKFGARTLAPLDVVSPIPANAPAVIQLRWDAPVDLDLQMVAPDGTVLSPKHPVAGNAQIDGDSVASCVDDGLHEENIYFTTAPMPGTYEIYVNPFSLCGKAGTNYLVTVTKNGAESAKYFGEAIAAEQRQGGFQVGTFIANVSF